MCYSAVLTACVPVSISVDQSVGGMGMAAGAGERQGFGDAKGNRIRSAGPQSCAEGTFVATTISVFS